jgi:hypothetical protein
VVDVAERSNDGLTMCALVDGHVDTVRYSLRQYSTKSVSDRVSGMMSVDDV